MEGMLDGGSGLGETSTAQNMIGFKSPSGDYEPKRNTQKREE